MQMFKFLILSSLFLSPLIGNDQPPSKTTYIYDKDVEGRVSKTTWTVEEKEETLHVQGQGANGDTLMITSIPLNTQSFSYQSKNKQHEYYIYREGPHLFTRLVDNGHVSQKEFNIGQDFWVQEFDFTFRPFILSTADSLKFYIVHPKQLSLPHMIAIKSKKLEQVQINGETFNAIKVKVTLTGFKKMFWKADLWFEEKTGDLIKYMANEGPNTPMSVITLFSKKIEN